MKLSFRTRAARGAILAVPVAATVALAIVLGGGAAVASGKSSKQAKAKNKPMSLTLGYIGTQNIYTGPEGFAYSKGLLQKWLKPYKVTIKGTAPFANGPLLTAALVGGSLQLGEVGDTPALVGESPVSGSSDNTRIINQDQVGLQAVLITQTSITKASQLENQGIYRQPQSYMDRWVQAVLKSKGLLSKVNLVPGLLNTEIPAFNSGQIPDLVLPSAQLTLITTKYNTLFNSEQTPAWTGTGVTEITKSALAQDPGLPAAWNAVRDEAIQYATAHQRAYYAFEAKAEETTVAVVKQYYPLSDDPLLPFTASGLAHLRGTLAFLVGQSEAKNFSIPAWQTPVGR
jgi:NitT/TauT family transport system substrate-binding protein/sulfonate transport system substrate-binding protein